MKLVYRLFPSMSHQFVAVGLFLVDEIYDLKDFPKEDSKVRAEGFSLCPGGSAANVCFSLKSLLPLSTVSLCACIGDDALGQFLLSQCREKQIDQSQLHVLSQQATSKSVVLRNSPSRTCIHVNICPEINFSQFASRPMATTSTWYHFEGRNPVETLLMMNQVKSAGFDMSLELERSRGNAMNEHRLLVTSPSVVVFSHQYLLPLGFTFHSVHSFFHDFLLHKESLFPIQEALWVVTFGDKGSVSAVVNPCGIVNNQVFVVVPPVLDVVVDSLGAGDVFMAGLIFARATRKDWTARQAVEFATSEAVRKLQKVGI